MNTNLTVKSRSHDYTVEFFDRLQDALAAVTNPKASHYLIDAEVARLYAAELGAVAPADRTTIITATEEQKSFDALTPHFLQLLQQGLKRTGNLVVIGGGVVQDIGCFIASVLYRGLRWELIPTTLLAQADSCIGSKSSINIGPYKNQIGTFYPPHRVLQVSGVLKTLPIDEIRSGMGEIIKLQLLKGPEDFRELMGEIDATRPDSAVISKWVARSMAVKQPYIESDEYDRGIRNLLNYGHTFGHAYESATHYGIPHGIAVTLGILTATYVSRELGLVDPAHYAELKHQLRPWHTPYGQKIAAAPIDAIFQAMKRDKKNVGSDLTCILTRGPGRMEKQTLSFAEKVVPNLTRFIANELN